MQYMLLIYDSEADGKKRPDAERQQMFQDYGTFTREIAQAGKLKAGDPLEPSTTATTVRVRNGKTVVTDGPFAETKEQLGGYYLVEAKDLDEAIAIAAKVPGSKFGSIEVRPVRKMSM
ncbi:MAG: YciI family protein [Candidatus Binatus sp.]|uniref:YciI family protein n=1 Tax=Candidatus Binatus sp. TaxID=2811406 RepID=UPI0027217E4C|nr:YciI family protein [Candidatus Binatus sp.]MDO8434052.1 YciI family protein [Candidatus Binatus sp.]